MDTDPSARPQGVPRLPGGGHETKDASVPWIFGIVAFLCIAGVAMHLSVARMLSGLRQSAAPTDRWRLPPNRAARRAVSSGAFPRLQVAPPVDLAALRAREERELKTYGWIDKTSGVVRLPIERAMELVLQAGLPVRKGTNQNRVGPSSFELEQQRSLHREPGGRQ